MRHVLLLAALVAVLSTSTAFAGDGHVPRATLDNLGLSGMEVLSDDAGAEVRGMSGNAMAMGLSLVSGVLIDPNTKSFVFGADVNQAMSSAENAGLQVLTRAQSQQASAIALNLDVTSVNGQFIGTLVGGAGGSAFARSQ